MNSEPVNAYEGRNMREIRYIDAIREAQWEEMRRDETIFIFGEASVLVAGVGPRPKVCGLSSARSA